MSDSFPLITATTATETTPVYQSLPLISTRMYITAYTSYFSPDNKSESRRYLRGML